MAEREASVKLTLDNGQFIVSLRRAGDAVEDVQKKAAKSASAWTAGLNGAKSAIGSLSGMVKQVVGAAAGLGGAFALGSGIHQAISLREQFRTIEFQIRKTGNATANWEDLLNKARTAAIATGHSTGEMGEAMTTLMEGVGDSKFAVGALEHVGNAAKVTNKSLTQWADVAGMLKEKFGATLETLPGMIAVVTEKTGSGALKLEDMGEKFALLAGEAADAGFTGEKGLSSVLGMLGALDDRLGAQSIPAFKKLFQVMKDGSAGFKDLQKDAGVKLAPDMSGAEKLRAFMSTAKGRKAMTEKLGGEQRVVFDELSKPFEEAFNSAKQSSKNTEAATAAGLAAFDKAMAAMGEHALTAKQLAAEAKKRADDDPMAQLKRAQEMFVEGLAKPEVFEAMDKLAKHLPVLAKKLAELVEWAVNNPIGAGLGAVAAVGGGGALKGMAGSLGGSLLSSMGDVLKGKAADAGGSFASKAFGAAGLAGAGIMLGAAVIAAFTEYRDQQEQEAKDKREAAIKKKGGDVAAIGTAVAGMTEEEAFKEYGDKGRRIKKGDLTPEEREAFSQAAQLESEGLDRTEAAVGRTKNTAYSAEMSIPGLSKIISPEAKPDAINYLKYGNLPTMPEGGWPAGAAPPAAAAPAGPTKVRIEDQDNFGQALARALSNSELKVKVVADSSGSRGPLKPPPPGES